MYTVTSVRTVTLEFFFCKFVNLAVAYFISSLPFETQPWHIISTNLLYTSDAPGQPKLFYSHMRKLQTVKDSVITLLKPDGKLTESVKKAADLLGSIFTEAYTIEDMTEFKPEQEGTHLDSKDSSMKFSKEEVLGKLLKLREDHHLVQMVCILSCWNDVQKFSLSHCQSF